MKVTVRVENHTPVPLRPLREVLQEAGVYRQAVYLGRTVFARYYTDDPPVEELGWVIYDGHENHVASFDGSFWLFVNDPKKSELNLDETQARLLQPGERLVVTYAGE